MDKFINIELLEDKDFNNYEKVHLFFYSEINSEIYFLLERDSSNKNNKFTHIQKKIEPTENSPIISLARNLTHKYKGILNNRLLSKIKTSQKLKLEDFEYFDYNELIYPERYSVTFIENIRKFDKNPIQYDRIKGNIFYFLPINFFETEFLNENLNKLLHSYSDNYNRMGNENSKYNQELLNLLNLEFKFFHLNEFHKSFENIINKTEEILFEENTLSYIDIIKPMKIFQKEKLIQKEKILFIDMHDQEKQTNDQTGFFLYYALFTGLYRLSNQEWIHIRPFEENLPNLDSVFNDETYKCVLIPGSHLHIYESNKKEFIIKTIEWIQNLFSYLKIINTQKNKNLKLLGICFGHQLISYALGGNVRKRLQGTRCNTIENIQILNEENNNSAFFKGLSKSEFDYLKLNLCEIHFDEVFIKPNGLNLLGSSDSCDFEILLSENNRVLTFQGHPEYNPEYQLFDTAPVKFKDLDIEQQLNFSKEFLEKHYIKYEYSFIFREVCFNFIIYDY